MLRFLLLGVRFRLCLFFGIFFWDKLVVMDLADGRI